MGVDQGQHLVPPCRQGSIGKIAVAAPAARIVEHEASPAVPTRPVEQGGSLAAVHVGHVTRQEDQRGALALAKPEGDPASI